MRWIFVATIAVAMGCRQGPQQVETDPPAVPQVAAVDVDLSEVMDRIRYSFHLDAQAADTFVGGRDTYTIAVAEGSAALSVVHQTNDGLSVAGPFSVTTRGGPSDPTIASDGHLQLVRDEHIEHWRNSVEGAEQSWEFPSAVSGALTVEVDVSGLEFVGQTESGLHFADASGLGFRYGNATWVDALGVNVTVPSQWVDGLIRLTVPADVVARSRFPAVLDPLIGPELAVDTPIVGGVVVQKQSPAVASDGTGFLAVWTERIGNPTYVRGVLVGPSGALVGDAFTISVHPDGDRNGPRAVFDGTNYMVVWNDRRLTGSRFDVFGARVSTAGVVLDPDAFPIRVGTNNSANGVDIATDGQGSMVIWQEPTANGRLWLARLSPTGVVLDESPVAVNTRTATQAGAHLTYAGTQYIATWRETVSRSSYDIYAARVATTGAVLDPDSILVADGGGRKGVPTAASDGTHTLVVWEDDGLFGKRLSPSGTVLDAAAVTILPESKSGLELVHQGSSYQLLFSEWAATSESVFTLPVAHDLTPSAAGPVLISEDNGKDNQIATAASASQVLAVWLDADDGRDGVGGSRLIAGVDQDVADLEIARDNNAQGAPDVARGPDNYLVVFTDSRVVGLSGTDIYGVRVDAAGMPLDDTAIHISGAANQESAPRVASDGTQFVVVWQDSRDSATSIDTHIYAARVGYDGVLLDPTGIAVSAGPDAERSPSVASSSSGSLVVWSDNRTPDNGSDVYGARIGLDGTVLDPAGFAISAGEQARNSPVVTWGGQSYLVAWQDYRNTATTAADIYAARVQGSSVLDPAGLEVCTASGFQFSQAVGAGGGQFLVTWADDRNVATTGVDIYGARLTDAGAVLDADGFPVVAAANGQTAPAVTHDGVAFTVAWNDDRGLDTDIFVSDVRSSGTTIPDDGTQVTMAPERQSSPRLASDGAGNSLVVYTQPVLGVGRIVGRLLTGLDAPGTACTSGDTCRSGACVESVCCESACDDSCYACTAAKTGVDNGTCAPETVGATCGDSSDTLCDNADTCDGAGNCLDNYEDTDIVCGDVGVECVVPDTCDGAGTCANNGFVDADTPCGDPVDGECTAADTCDGAGTCLDNHASSGNACGDAATECVVADACDGDGACTDNGFVDSGTPCGDSDDTTCTDPDTCDGAGTCATNHAADNTACATDTYCLSGDTCASGDCVEGALATCSTDETCLEDSTECVPACGDGSVRSDEQCDDGSANSNTVPDACRMDCTFAACGDGVVDIGETCDDPTGNSDTLADACRLDCTPARCGDGVIDTTESCDDGEDNSDAADASCRPDCALATCGDGIVDTGEDCDDGEDNADAADACRTTCVEPTCGDDIVDDGEECDGTTDCDSDCAILPDLDTDTASVDGGSCSTAPQAPASLLILLVLGTLARRRSQPGGQDSYRARLPA